MQKLTMALAMALIPMAALAGDEWSVGRIVPAGDRVSINDINHRSWHELVQQYVNDDGMVDYAAWKSRDLAKLNSYLDELARADLDKPASREAKLVYWINAYNAVTVRGILREYPTSSIRNHTAKLWGYNIWKQLFLNVDGQKVNLDSIEHAILRPMGEPRIHFAIVCASIGCPRLLNEAYVADQLDEQLTRNARDFFSRKQNLQVKGNRVYLSSILDWFGEDFGSSRSAQLKRVAPYVPDAHEALFKGGRASVSFLDYDWNLNAQK